MPEAVKLFPIVLYWLVAIIAFVMAYKNILATKLLPFQQQVAGESWDKIGKPLQAVIIAIMQVSGLGFLVVGLFLALGPAVNYFHPQAFLKFAIPAISAVYCLGLFAANRRLSKNTGAAAPWKGSLYAALLLIVSLAISCL